MTELRRLVAAKERMPEGEGGFLKHEMMKDVNAVEDESPAEEEKVGGA